MILFIQTCTCEWVVLKRHMSNISDISWCEHTSYIKSDDNYVRFVLDQKCLIIFYSASPLKQQSSDSQVNSFGHINQILIRPIFALFP